MIPLLLTLLIVSLAIILVGFFLSARPSGRAERDRQTQRTPLYDERRTSYYDERPVRRSVSASPQSAGPLRASRYTAQMPPQRRPVVAMSVAVAPAELVDRRARTQPFPWKIATVGLISTVIIGLYSLTLVLPHDSFLSYNPFADAVLTTPAAAHPAPVYKASQLLVRLSQLDPAQYNSTSQYNLWAYSACSTAAMTEVFNAYGRHYRVVDILAVESRIGEITPQLGLLEDAGIAHTATQFGFNTSWGHQLSLNQIIDIANHGRPVIVSFPPDRYAGGHLLVVRGGSGDYVYTADSSRLNHTYFTRERFTQLWGGFSAIVTPR